MLDGKPGIYSARWSGKKNNFNIAIKKVLKKMNVINKKWVTKNPNAKFTCCLTIYWPNGKVVSSTGIVKGKISKFKKGKKGFGYDPIFIPSGHSKTFGEMNPKVKMKLDHRFRAFSKIKNFFI